MTVISTDQKKTEFAVLNSRQKTVTAMFNFCRRHFLKSTWFWLVLMTAIVLFGFSNAEATFPGVLIAFYAFPLWLAVWFLRLLIWVFWGRTHFSATLPKPWLSWSIEPLFCVLLIGCVWFNLFMWGRFILSQPFLEDFAQDKIALMSTSGPKSWHGYKQPMVLRGLYTIMRWETSIGEDGSAQILIKTADETLTDEAGFAYVPSGGKPRSFKTHQPCSFDHLFGPWWRWRLDV